MTVLIKTVEIDFNVRTHSSQKTERQKVIRGKKFGVSSKSNAPFGHQISEFLDTAIVSRSQFISHFIQRFNRYWTIHTTNNETGQACSSGEEPIKVEKDKYIGIIYITELF